MALIDVYHALKADSAVKQRFVGAVVTAASQVLTEDEATVNHANRLIWANDVHTNPESVANQMWPSALTNATVLAGVAEGSEVTDNDLQWVCNSLIDTFATGV